MTSAAIPEKHALRIEVLARRDAAPVEWRIEASMAIAALGGEAVEIGPAETVAGFWPIRSEVDVRPLMAALADRGARLALPAVIDSTTIVFRALERGGALIETGYGTAGPGPDAATVTPSVVLVPLAAFDARGHRLGYGAGYYDRAIAELTAAGKRPRLVGVAFDLQEVEQVPAEPHDEPLDAILTESGLRSIGGKR